MVGRNHPKHDISKVTANIKESAAHILNTHEPIYVHDASDIITYLRISHHDANLTQNTNQDTFMHESLILETLQPILEYRRNCSGNVMQDSLYQMSMKASYCHTNKDSTDSKYSANAFLHPFAAFQHWATKVISQRDSRYWRQKNRSFFSKSRQQNTESEINGIFIHGQLWSHSSNNVEDMATLLTTVKESYACLESVILIPNSTASPILLDVLLYAHLCEAIMDPEYLFILSGFPNILQFFKQMHSKYFGEQYTGISKQGEGETHAHVLDWVQYNNQMNHNNAHYPAWMFSFRSSKKSKNGSSEPVILESIQKIADSMSKISESELGQGIQSPDAEARIKQVEQYLNLFPIRHSYTNPANAFHRIRLEGSLYSDGRDNIDLESFEESFGGYLSSNYLTSKMRWYYKYIFPTESDMTDGMGKNKKNNNGLDGEQWMKAQKKIALENDRQWIGLVAGAVGIVFVITSSEKSRSQ